jgi:hypothetical protein
MGVEVISSKYFYKDKNGIDFTQNLSDFTVDFAGYMLEDVKYTCDVLVYAYTELRNWYLADLGSGNRKVTMNGGEFSSKGISVGDSVVLTSESNSWTISATILTVESDTFSFHVNSTTGTLPLNQTHAITATDYIHVVSSSTSLIYKQNFVNDSVIFDNFYDGTTQAYSFNGLNTTTSVSGESLGNIKGWVSGEVSCIKIGSAKTGLPATAGIVNTGEVFRITHILKASPFYSEDNDDDYANDINPPFLFGDETMRPIYYFEFRKEFGNVQSRKFGVYDKPASTGGFGEAYNGLNLPYNIDSIDYIVDGLSSESLSYGVTEVEINVSTTENNFDSDTKFILYHYLKLKNNEASYKKTNFNSIWNYESQLITESTTTPDGSIFKNMNVEILTSSTAKLTFLVDTSTLTNTTNPNYGIAVGFSDYTKTALTDNRGVRVVYGDYIKNYDVSGLLEVEDFNIYALYDDLEMVGKTNIDGIIQDDVLIRGRFKIKDGAKMQNFRISIFGNGYEINSIDYDLTAPIIDDILQLNINESLNFDVPNSEFNIKKLVYVSNDAGFSSYDFQVNYKLSHQSWLQASELDPHVFDQSEDKNGQNQSVIRYDDVKYAFTTDLKYEGLTTTYRVSTVEFNVTDYNREISTTGVSSPYCSIETFTLDDTSLNGKFLNSGKTKVKARFKQVTPSLDFTCVAYGESGISNNNDLKLFNFITKTIEGDEIVFSYEVENIKRFSARLYSSENIIIESFLLLEDGYMLLLEDGELILL